jgi:hypothetical protein
MAIEIVMPKLSDTMEEGTFLAKKEGTLLTRVKSLLK